MKLRIEKKKEGKYKIELDGIGFPMILSMISIMLSGVGFIDSMLPELLPTITLVTSISAVIIAFIHYLKRGR